MTKWPDRQITQYVLVCLERRRWAGAKSLRDATADDPVSFPNGPPRSLLLASWGENGRRRRFPRYPRLAFTSTAIQSRVCSQDRMVGNLSSL